MEFCFVYSSGGGAGDWNAIDRIWNDHMPPYFRDHLLLKFGDIFFNHRSSKNLIKPSYWANTGNARDWIIGNTNDKALSKTKNLIMDVGTSKIVSYITHHNPRFTGVEVIQEFDRLMSTHRILDKYCDVINASNITNAVTFDIPNLFKVRTQNGNVARNLFHEEGCRELLVDACVRYANFIYQNTGRNPDSLLTIICAHWSDQDILEYLDRLDYTPTKLSVGGLTDYARKDFSTMLNRLNALLDFQSYAKVHFLGSGGLVKASMIINELGNHDCFSVDNTTPYNRAIDGNTTGTSMSGYYDYVSKSLIRISPQNRCRILELHAAVPNDRALFSVTQMSEIIDSILEHQAQNSSHLTYNSRAKLVLHNFDVYKHNVE